MKKRSKKLLALLTTAAMAVMMISSVVNAETDPYEPVEGGSFTCNKYLVVPNDMSIPEITFKFDIGYGEAVAGDKDNVRIYAGDDENRVEITTEPSIADVKFEENQDTTDGAANDGIANDTDHKYATKTVTVDLSGVTYKEPGVYRYIITEQNSQEGAVYDTTPRTLDVNVINGDQDGELEIEGYTMYYGNSVPAQPKEDDVTKEYKKGADATITEGDKCDSFVNSYPATSLSVGKVVSGNQASKDQYFRFTVNIKGAPKGTIMRVDRSHCDASVDKDVNGATKILDGDLEEGATAYTNPATITVPDSGEVTAVFYLQHNQFVTIMGVPKGSDYEVSEDDYSSEGYTKLSAAEENFTIKTGPGEDDKEVFKETTSETIGDDDVYTGFTNEKDGTIPTGVIISVAGLLIVGIFSIIGFVFFGIRSKRRYEED